ncbi:MAG: alpha/beta hydrolase [Bacteroidota bacterium]
MNALNAAQVREAEGVARREVWFLHGYGSHEGDLFGLARLLPRDWTVRSLRAPRPLEHGGFAWYDLHFDAQGVRHMDATQVRESMDSLIEALEHSEAKPVLLGFSQGGIIANALALSRPELISGCVAVASYAPMEWFQGDVIWNPDPGLPHLAVVGDEDGVIPPELSVPSYERAQERGATLSVQRFRMGHGIAPDSWQAITSWFATF